MREPVQETLVEIERSEEPRATLAPAMAEAAPAARLRAIDRSQSSWGPQCIDDLIPSEHRARAIWELTGKLDLSGFLNGNKSVAGVAGRERNDPRLLVSVWVYAYSLGMGSAREIERQMKHEPGLRWLTGDVAINHHTLSDFRVDYGAAVKELFAEVLSVLEAGGLVRLEEVTLDGTKIEAAGGGSSFRREKTLRERLTQAQQLVEQLSQESGAEALRSKQVAAQQRAARERQARCEQALKELEILREHNRGRKDPEELRASLTEPEARIMKDGHGGYDASYNVQSVVETSHGIMVNVGITQHANDSGQLEPALDRVKEQTGRDPERALVDGGYISRDTVEAMQERNVELFGPVVDEEAQRARNTAQSLALAGIAAEFGPAAFVVIEEGQRLQCPAGSFLQRKQETSEHIIYQAAREACGRCLHRAQCCPQSEARTIKRRKQDPLGEHQRRMRTEAAQHTYRKRGPVAEFPHAWFKDKLKLRKFHVWGLAKAGLEAMWAAITYNVQQWERLLWRNRPEVAA
jgi:transposase